MDDAREKNDGGKYYTVAVYWSREGVYGRRASFDNLEDARREADALLRSGFGKPESPIHIREHFRPRLLSVVTKQG